MKPEKRKSKHSFKRYKNIFTGIIHITNQGFAFVKIKEYKKEIYIPKHKTGKSLVGDLVKIKLNRNRRKLEGEVLKIIKRKRNNFIGILKLNFKPNSITGSVIIHYLHVDILIMESESNLKKEHQNNKVLVKIVSWPKNFDNPLGKIIRIFGKSGEYKTEIFSLLEERGLSFEFPKKVENEAEEIFVRSKSYHDDVIIRKDMRNITTFTIDPLDAKDFDDAISVRKLNSEIWEIGIHISDVTHYVKEDSLLDKEAYDRATSIYFTGKVIPMLPKILSNDLCSLQPKKDKLSFSLVFNINKEGKILKNWIGKTIIQSNRKFTYDEVQKIIDEKKGDFYEEIYVLFHFSKILTKNRLKNGAIYLEKDEVKFCLDENKNPTFLYLEKCNEAHKLIEELMLLTNRKISEFINNNTDKKNCMNIPYIYRVHDKPDYEKIFFLKKIIKPLGYSFDLKNLKYSINLLLKQAKGKPEQNMIENLVLRAMSKAKYSTNNIGHYGLSFLYYTHFTSPIRRYSDIIAHRLLYYFLTMKKNRVKTIDFYEKQSQHCSDKERLAIDIEREFSKYLQVKYLKKFLGKEFDGIITGFTDWSVYVDLLSFKTEGMVKLRDIKEDYYILNSNNYSIIGRKNKKIYQLGDKVKVKLLNVNIEKKQIKLDWIEKKF